MTLLPGEGPSEVSRPRTRASPARPPRPESDVGALRRRLEGSLPALMGGVLCVGVAALLAVEHLRVDDARIPVWLLIGAVGSILLGGGFVLTLVEEPTPGLALGSPGDYVLVPRATWERFLQSPAARVPSTVAPPPSTELRGIPSIGTSAGPEPAANPPVPEDLVSAVSSEILADARTPSEPPELAATTTLPSATPPAVASPAIVRNEQRPVPAAPAPPTPPARAAPGAQLSPPKPPSPQLESVLTLLERAEASVRSRMGASSTDPVRERCIGCGAPVSTYSEQVCVGCDRPLCDRCIDRTAADGHPQMCDSCSRTFPSDLS